MTSEQRLERDLPLILGDLAMGPYPDYIDDVLAGAAERRQRPAWTFPERWFPVDITTRRVSAPGLPWRQIGILAVIGLIVVTAIAVYAGSRPRLPAPFGLAANGFVADALDGDIRVIDPDTGNSTVIVSGPAFDTDPVFSRDGTRIVFMRTPAAEALDTPQLYSVRPDGSELTLLTPEPLAGLGWYEFTVDDSAVVIQSEVDGYTRISLAATDGSGVRTFEDVVVAIDGGLALRPPDGHEVLFETLHGFNGMLGGISSLDLDTGVVTPVVPGQADTGVFSNIVWSPAGDRFAYARYYRRANIELHIADADGSNDHVVGHADGASFEAWPQWSPSGRYLLFERKFGLDVADSTYPVHPVVVDLETGTEVAIKTEISHNGAGKEWAPDESTVMAVRTDEGGVDLPAELWDVRTGAVTLVPWGSPTHFSWQRKAP